MSGHFNRLTPAQAERLAILAEECGEVIQVVGKILRHGYDSHHPIRNVDNISMLEQELGDLGAAVFMLAEAKDIDHRNVEVAIKDKRHRVKKYMHHYEGPANDFD